MPTSWGISACLRLGGLVLTLLLLACQSSPSLSGGTPVTPSPLARSAGPLSLGTQPATAALAGPALASPLAAAGHRRYLLLRGLTASAQPGVTYSVYLDLPAGVTPTANDPRWLGTVNFFAARPPGAPPGPDAPSPRNHDEERLFFSFDLTDTLAALRRGGLLLPHTTVTFIPDGRPQHGARVVVGRLEIVDQ